MKTRFNTLAHLPAPFHDKHRKSKAFLSLSSRSSWHPFYTRTSPWKMRFFPYVGPTGETDGTIANDRSRFIEYVSTYCFVEGGRIIETCVGAVECCVARRRRVWRKFAASKGINKAREANGVATCANEPDVLLPLTIVQYRGRHRPRNESLNRV